jgi:predicted ester cyclase
MEANREILDRYVALYNVGDLGACMELYADDAVQRMHDGIFEGRDAIGDRLARDLEAFADANYVVDSFVDQGDRFADEWTFTGTNTGSFRLPDGSEVAATGKRVEIKGMELVQVRAGKIVVDNLYYDFMAAVVQLDLVPQGAAG